MAYSVYTAILNQEGLNAPIATVLENTIGNIVWGREGSGYYVATSAEAAFPEAKTFVVFTHGDTSNSTALSFSAGRNSDDRIELTTLISEDNSSADDYVKKSFIEIRVYP